MARGFVGRNHGKNPKWHHRGSIPDRPTSSGISRVGVRNGSLSKWEPEVTNKFIDRLLHSVRHEGELLTFIKLTERERERERRKKFLFKFQFANARRSTRIYCNNCLYVHAVGLVAPLAACSGKTKQNSHNHNFINEFCDSCKRNFVNAFIT